MNIDKNKTVWQNIFDVLKEHFDVFPPATHKGECKSPYLVLKTAGTSSYIGISSKARYYEILVYVPQNEYDKLEVISNNVSKVIEDELVPMIMPTGQEQPDFFDDSVNAHMRSIQYRNNVRDKNVKTNS